MLSCRYCNTQAWETAAMQLFTVCAHDRSVLVVNMPRQRAHHVLDEALNSWLGADLTVRQHNGQPIWNGDPDALHARTATNDEAQTWHSAWPDRPTVASDADPEPRPVYLVAHPREA